MIKYFLTFLMLSIICSCSYSQQNDTNTKSDTSYYKATLIPLKVDQPTTKTKTIKSNDPSYLNLVISENIITAKLYNHLTQLNDTSSLKKFLIDNETKIDKTKVIIVNDKNSSADKFKEVIAILSISGITKFSVVSH